MLSFNSTHTRGRWPCESLLLNVGQTPPRHSLGACNCQIAIVESRRRVSASVLVARGACVWVDGPADAGRWSARAPSAQARPGGFTCKKECLTNESSHGYRRCTPQYPCAAPEASIPEAPLCPHLTSPPADGSRRLAFFAGKGVIRWHAFHQTVVTHLKTLADARDGGCPGALASPHQ